MADGYNKHIEEIVDEVAERLAEKARVIEAALIPDGRPLFAEGKSDEARLGEYMMRRGNPQAQYEYLQSLVQSAVASLAEVGVDPASVSPWDIAINYAMIESAELEGMLREETPEEDASFVGTVLQ